MGDFPEAKLVIEELKELVDDQELMAMLNDVCDPFGENEEETPLDNKTIIDGLNQLKEIDHLKQEVDTNKLVNDAIKKKA